MKKRLFLESSGVLSKKIQTLTNKCLLKVKTSQKLKELIKCKNGKEFTSGEIK
ncbi:hypothetical protein [Methanosarcina sp. KYL-1]|uniref:hypothetical protein n=1 Tax=Methanosarcina sp. KYL-1 TaxID=2602068 RepID=UPI002101C53A|nr:hypothetical protein [Methanosarcina sp. KYL-1]